MTVSVSPQKLIMRILQSIVATPLLAYVADSLWFRLRMIHPEPSDPLESFTRPRVLAIPEKGNKVSYEIDSRILSRPSLGRIRGFRTWDTGLAGMRSRG